MMKRTMSSFKNAFEGRPAAVLGGGPSLPADMAKLPENCILIAVNYHAMRICRPQFMVYNDQPQSDPLLHEAVYSGKCVRVSPEPSSDVVFDVDVWTGFYSSNTAAWFALYMGCDPVILCGMDCYQGERKYFHEYTHDNPSFHYPLDWHTRPWVEEGLNLLPHVKRLRAMSGPLADIFGLWIPEAARVIGAGNGSGSDGRRQTTADQQLLQEGI